MTTSSARSKSIIRIGLIAITLLLVNLFYNFDDSNTTTNIHQRYLQGSTTEENESNYAIDNNIRIVSFGTSRSWGSGLNNPTKESFPALLNARNEAIRASDSNYPAMCTYSMIGKDKVVDVITIEYMPMSFWGTRDSITLLGRRLRQRFPDATIIFLNVWTPHQFFYKPTNTGLRQFVMDNTEVPRGHPIPTGALEAALEKTSSEDWEFYGFNEDWLQDAANDPLINGTILSLTIPNMEDPLLSILSVAPLYLNDMSHFSKLGHVWVKNRIVDILQKEEKQQSNRINPWESTDQCLSWFETGETELSTNMPMNEFSPTKFALQADKSRKLNFIELRNDNDRPQHLYISHMSTGPQEFYPEVIAEIHPSTDQLDALGNLTFHETHATFIESNTTLWPEEVNVTAKKVQTCYKDTPAQFPIHVLSHHYIGEVPVGSSYLNLKPSKDTNYPFRTTGIILAPEAFGEKVEAIF